MATIGEVYNPLVEAAKSGRQGAMQMIEDVGRAILAANPDKCKSLEEGISAAKHNLDYYCQYFDEATADKVKEVYGLGAGFVDLMGNKYNFK